MYLLYFTFYRFTLSICSPFPQGWIYCPSKINFPKKVNLICFSSLFYSPRWCVIIMGKCIKDEVFFLFFVCDLAPMTHQRPSSWKSTLAPLMAWSCGREWWVLVLSSDLPPTDWATVLIQILNLTLTSFPPNFFFLTLTYLPQFSTCNHRNYLNVNHNTSLEHFRSFQCLTGCWSAFTSTQLNSYLWHCCACWGWLWSDTTK